MGTVSVGSEEKYIGILLNKVIREDIFLKKFNLEKVEEIEKEKLDKFIKKRIDCIDGNYGIPKPQYYDDFIGIGEAARE